MDILFKIYVLLIAGTIGLTIDVLFELLFFRITPSPIAFIALPASWALMIKTNPVWKKLWENWTKK